jgi:hypothetical protein
MVFLCQLVVAQFKNTTNWVPGTDFRSSNYRNGTSEIGYNLPSNSFEISKESPVAKISPEAIETYRKQMSMMVPGTGTEYDVKYYRLELRINPDTAAGNYVRGKVTTYFTTSQANFNSINFDMASQLTADSVYYHGVKVTAGNIARPTDLIKITIPTIAAIGTLDSVSIYYKGAPPAVVAPGLSGTGYVTATHSSAPIRNYVYTLSEPYSSYTWWPCKSFVVVDKADSMDMIVSTPNTFRVASNGTLVSETPSGSSTITYWKERYPLSAYQVCAGVANYVQYPTTPTMVNIGGTSMPVYNFIFPETNTPAAHTSLDRVPLMITTFNSLYGDYPFKNEKYGNYSFGFGGGMEHNTFSGESTSGVYTSAGNWDVLAHELAHQWWGANVTNASWDDIWLHESFADFSEAICLEFAPSIASSVGVTDLSWRASKKTNTLSAVSQATYVSDTSSILTIFTPSVYIYDRGGMIISMLRKTLGDTKFFQALKNYQSDPSLKLGCAFTADMKRHMENVSALNLTTFFNNWIYNTGYAKYSGIAGSVCSWNNSGKDLTIKLVQKTQSSGITHFDMPVVVRIQGSVPATQDTTVILYDMGGIIYKDVNGALTTNGNTMLGFHLSFVPVTFTMDAFSQTLATGTFSKDALLPVSLLATNILSFTGTKDGNDAKLAWSVDNSLDYASFEIEKSNDGNTFDKIGTILAADNLNVSSFGFTDYNLSNGTSFYRIKIIQKNGTILYTKIISVQNKLDSHFTISPNPATDYIIISGSGLKENVDIKMFDANGKLVKKLIRQSFLNNNNLRLSVDDLTSGIYFVQIIIPGIDNFTKQISIVR